MKTDISASAGFTIVEVLVSIAVAAIVTTSLNQVVTTYLHVSQRGRYLNLANSYVEAKVEAMRNIGYSGLAVGTSSLTSELPSQLPPSRSATMAIIDLGGGIKKVDLSVSYFEQGQSNAYAYTTYIGELGVGQ